MAHVVDEELLDNPLNEEVAALSYYFQATVHFLNTLEADQNLRVLPMRDAAADLVEFWNKEPALRDGRDPFDAALDTVFYGTIGKALWFQRQQGISAQLRRELDRLSRDEGAVVGNHYLFYVAGMLGAHGFEVEFVAEEGQIANRTPDLVARKDGRTYWVEANAKQPVIEVDTPERIQRLVQSIIEEKSRKFVDQRFSGGIIAADVSPAHYWVNRANVTPNVKLRREVMRPHPGGGDGFVYPLADDVEWPHHIENQDNIFRFLVDEFQQLDRTRYFVDQLLITVTRRVVRSGRSLELPKGHQLLVHRDAEARALHEAAKHIYVVG